MNSFAIARKVMWMIYVHKHVSRLIYLMLVHTQKKDVCKHVVISNQQNILLHWHSSQWLAHVYILIMQCSGKAVCSPSCHPNLSKFLFSVEHEENKKFWRTMLLICCIQLKHTVISYLINLKLSLFLII